MREKSVSKGLTFRHFSDAAQQIGVYTALDYINIMQSLIKEWEIEGLRLLTDASEKARDYVLALPERLNKLAERMVPPETNYQFSWIHPATVKIYR